MSSCKVIQMFVESQNSFCTLGTVFVMNQNLVFTDSITFQIVDCEVVDDAICRDVVNCFDKGRLTVMEQHVIANAEIRGVDPSARYF